MKSNYLKVYEDILWSMYEDASKVAMVDEVMTPTTVRALLRSLEKSQKMIRDFKVTINSKKRSLKLNE